MNLETFADTKLHDLWQLKKLCCTGQYVVLARFLHSISFSFSVKLHIDFFNVICPFSPLVNVLCLSFCKISIRSKCFLLPWWDFTCPIPLPIMLKGLLQALQKTKYWSDIGIFILWNPPESFLPVWTAGCFTHIVLYTKKLKSS